MAAEEMSEPDREHGAGILSRISTGMVQAQKEHYGRGPERAKSYMVDDFLFVIMRGDVTSGERTLLEAGKEHDVRQFRQTFENVMEERLVDLVEEVTGRKVINYQSQIMFRPDVVF